MYERDEQDIWNAIKFQPNDYQVVGRKENGETVYYTGRAGQGFVSNQLCDAFSYSSLDRARTRAAMLNRTSELTGIRFIVPCGDKD